MDRWAGKVAVVTGASAGIGLATAAALVEKGMIVFGLARRKDKMEEGMKNVQGPGKFYALECDVSSEDNVVNTFAKIKNSFGTVHVLVNNAGMATRGSTIDLDTKKMEQCIKVNLLGVLYCTKQAVKLMRSGDHEGHVINVGSVTGHKVVYSEFFLHNVYSPTKFAVRALSENLQNELGKSTKIRVTHISPGVVITNFFELAQVDPFVIQQLVGLQSEDVADSIVYVLGTKPHVHIPELSIRCLHDPSC